MLCISQSIYVCFLIAGKQVVLESRALDSESSSLASSSDSESTSVTSTLDSETSSLASVHSIMSISSFESDDFEGDSDSHHWIICSATLSAQGVFCEEKIEHLEQWRDWNLNLRLKGLGKVLFFLKQMCDIFISGAYDLKMCDSKSIAHTWATMTKLLFLQQEFKMIMLEDITSPLAGRTIPACQLDNYLNVSDIQGFIKRSSRARFSGSFYFITGCLFGHGKGLNLLFCLTYVCQYSHNWTKLKVWRREGRQEKPCGLGPLVCFW